MTTSVYVPGIYRSTPPTLVNNEQTQLQMDAAGNLKTVVGGTVPLPTGAATEVTLTDLNANAFAMRNSLALLDDTGFGEYETVAASQTGQALGATGATGDWLESLLVIPATTSPGVVTVLDNAISIPVFVGGASSILTLHPFTIMIRARSVSGAWKVTTGANVSVLATGNFT